MVRIKETNPSTNVASSSSRPSKARKDKGKAIVVAPTSNPTTPKPRKPTARDYYQVLKNKIWVQTRWGDRSTLEKLGIYDDVICIARHMGMEKFFFLGEYGDHEATCQFLSTLDYEDGAFDFKINGEKYNWTTSGLNEWFDFPRGDLERVPKTNLRETTQWKRIGRESYLAGAKATGIKHPAVRYVHKLLANTFYARKDGNKVNRDELYFLAMGVEHIGEFAFMRIDEKVDYSAVLLKYLMEVRHLLFTTKTESTPLMVGGIVTSILRSFVEDPECALNITLESGVPGKVDIAYLSKNRFLGGATQSLYGYLMPDGRKFILPNPEATTLSNPANLDFQPTHGFYDPNVHPTLNWVSRSQRVPRNRKMAANESEPQEDEGASYEHQGEEDIHHDEEEIREEEEEVDGSDDDEVYGSHRYHFDPFDGPVTTTAMRYHHEKMKTLHKWNKWQDRTINKLVKAVKGLKGQVKSLKNQVKSLTSKLKGEGSSGARAQGEFEEAMDVDEEERRRSFGGASNALVLYNEPSRHSSYDGPRRRRQRRRMRSPTPPSSNASYSLDTEDYSGSPF